MRRQRRANRVRTWIVVALLAVLVHVLLLSTAADRYRQVFRGSLDRAGLGGSFQGDFKVVEVAVQVPATESRPRVPTPPRSDPEPIQVVEAEPLEEAEEGEAPAPGGAPEGESARTPSPAGGGDAEPGADRAGPSGSAAVLEPRLVFWPVPDYPSQVKKKIDGVVELRVLVGRNGLVQEAKLLSGMPVEACNQAALEAVLRSRWEPGLREGRPVPTWTTFTFRFSAK
jgi:protein TonB